MMRAAYALRRDDDDFSQAGTMVREVFGDVGRERFVANIAGHVLGGVKAETLPRVYDYWKNVDPEIGKQIEEAVRAGNDGHAPGQAEADGVIDSPSRR
jgi:catalase